MPAVRPEFSWEQVAWFVENRSAGSSFARLYIQWYYVYMALKHKHLILDQKRIKRAQKLMGTRTDTETVQQALDEVIRERERNLEARKAHEEFLSADIDIEDVYGLLEP